MDRFDPKRQLIMVALREIAGRRGGETLRVWQAMTQNPITISYDATILELVQLFHTREFRHPLVTDAEGRLVGVVSDRDVIRCFGPGKYPEEDVLRSITTAEIMSTDLVTTTPDATLDSALELLFGYGINCLPVLNTDKLVGILTTSDLYVVLECLLASLADQGESADEPLEQAAR